MTNLAVFVAAVATILATPGPTNALLSTSAALVGVRRSLPLMAAEILGYYLSIGTLTAVSAPLIASSRPFAISLRVALTLYLLWLAWRLWRSGDVGAQGQGVITWRRVFITTVLNPKGLIFAFGVFPVLGGAKDVVVHFGLFAATTLVVAFGWMTLGAFVAPVVDLRGMRVPLPRITAVVLVLFAGLLAASIPGRAA